MSDIGRAVSAIAQGVGQGLQGMASYSGQAASRANGVSAAAQANQGAFNQASANNANTIATDRIAQQYSFNAAQAAMANDFSREQFERAMEFNAKEAQKQRDWQERMMNTAYQRAVTDMSKAGLNPILAVTGGGISTGSGGGSAASISSPTGQAASGGMLQGVSASESSYTGQMEYMGGMLGLLAASMNGISSAMAAFAQMGVGESDFIKFLNEMLDNDNSSLVERFRKSKAYNAYSDLKNNIKDTVNPKRWNNGDYNPYD